jgi:AcrR family transcriptional regulator
MVRRLEDYAPGARALILTAERLFGEHGINGVSLRQILAAAGQANSSAVQHHFGSKTGLIAAAYRTREQTLEAARAANLAALDPEELGSLKALLRAWLMPILELLSAEERLIYARFMLQLLPLDDKNHPYFQSLQFSPASVELTRRIKGCLPELPSGVFNTRLRLAVSLFLEGVRNERRVLAISAEAYGGVTRFWNEIFQIALAALTCPFPPAETLPESSNAHELSALT